MASALEITANLPSPEPLGTLQPVGSFLLYFGVALLFEAVFIAVYTAVTPHREVSLIKQGNGAASISLGGAILGFTLPLGSVIAHSVDLAHMAMWSGVALLVQLGVFLLVNFLLRDISHRIEDGNLAVASTLAVASLVIGLINAASMTY
jgi:putative membrane protein